MLESGYLAQYGERCLSRFLLLLKLKSNYRLASGYDNLFSHYFSFPIASGIRLLLKAYLTPHYGRFESRLQYIRKLDE